MNSIKKHYELSSHFLDEYFRSKKKFNLQNPWQEFKLIISDLHIDRDSLDMGIKTFFFYSSKDRNLPKESWKIGGGNRELIMAAAVCTGALVTCALFTALTVSTAIAVASLPIIAIPLAVYEIVTLFKDKNPAAPARIITYAEKEKPELVYPLQTYVAQQAPPSQAKVQLLPLPQAPTPQLLPPSEVPPTLQLLPPSEVPSTPQFLPPSTEVPSTPQFLPPSTEVYKLLPPSRHTIISDETANKVANIRVHIDNIKTKFSQLELLLNNAIKGNIDSSKLNTFIIEVTVHKNYASKILDEIPSVNDELKIQEYLENVIKASSETNIIYDKFNVLYIDLFKTINQKFFTYINNGAKFICGGLNTIPNVDDTLKILLFKRFFFLKTLNYYISKDQELKTKIQNHLKDTKCENLGSNSNTIDILDKIRESLTLWKKSKKTFYDLTGLIKSNLESYKLELVGNKLVTQFDYEWPEGSSGGDATYLNAILAKYDRYKIIQKYI